MIPTNEYDFHEKLRFGTILAGIGGFLDVYTFILHNGVFANAQTGNIVLIGVSISENKIFDTLKYIYPVLAFILGVVFSELIKSTRKNKKIIDWTVLILVIEAIILFVIGFLPSSMPDICITTAISFISSVQISSFKKIRNSPYNTTMMTGNLRAFTEYLFRYIKTRDQEKKVKSIQYFIIIICFILGAGLGSILIKIFNAESIWICCLLQIYLIVQLKIESSRKPTNALT